MGPSPSNEAFKEGIKEGEILSVGSDIDLNENIKCGEKFSKDFPMCNKIVENAQTNNHSKGTEIYVETRKGKITGNKRIFYFNLKELQAEISGSVITNALGFL